MNFNKPMIDLVREIRKRVPSENKPGIKLANPELFDELLVLYKASPDTILKTLTKELFFLAQDGWPSRLEGKKEAESSGGKEKAAPVAPAGKRYITKVYRGQTTLTEVAVSDSDSKPTNKKIYRGQLVES